MSKYCSKCKEPNHLPLKCEEVEKDEEIEARRAIEERMTEALIRLVIHFMFQLMDE
jgi:E3 ubiquitin-protein ligase RNF216